MMKRFIICVLALSPLFFLSCKKEYPSSVEVNNLTKSEESKQVVIKTANDLALEMKDLEKEEGLKHLSQALNFIDFESISPTLSGSSIVSNLTDYSNVSSSNNKLPNGAYNKSKSLNDEIVDFETIKGIYTWNFTNEDWDVIKSDKIEFNFPLLEGVKRNNGILKIDFNYSKGNNILPNQSTPNNLIAELMFESNSILTYEMRFNYGSTGVPILIMNELRTNFYSIGYLYNFSNGDVLISQYIRHNSKDIFNNSVEIKGNFNENDAYELTQNYDNSNIDNLPNDVTSVEYKLQILNIATSFKLDNQKILEVQKLDQNNIDYNLLNDIVTVKVTNLNNNSILAATEIYDENGSTSLRLVFSDGSKISLQSYFDEMSNDIEVFFEESIGNLNN
jgi:hypothetical protein